VLIIFNHVLRMLCDVASRIQPNDIKQHPFFRGVDWANMRRVQPPFVPKLSSITDTSYFPTDELTGVPDQLGGQQQPQQQPQGTVDAGSDLFSSLAFLGYTYRRWDTYKESL
jgi:protein-serine/threonine kinase